MNIDEYSGSEGRIEETEVQNSQRKQSILTLDQREDSARETPDKSEISNVNSSAANN